MDGTLTLNLDEQEEPEVTLPDLREELALYPDSELPDGSSNWTIHDVTRNRFFQITWPELEILHRWKLRSPDLIVESVNKETTLHIQKDTVLAVLEFLFTNQLVRVTESEGVNYLEAIYKTSKQGMFKTALHKYLFFRIPLFRPNEFLDKTLPYVKFFYNRTFLWILTAMIFLGVYLVSRQWETFTNTFLHFYSLEGMIIFAVALMFSKMCHEFGHAYSAKYFGVKVPVIGVAFLVMWPVLYTDTSEAWKLRWRKPRLIIGASGMVTELLLAALATLAWSLFPDGALRSAMFMLATSTWVLTLLVNLNPLMRFDGYYLLSDYLGVKNLQDRSFALAKWKIREILFKLNHKPPEFFRPRIQRTLIYYAWATWVYRFLLFLGIALLVYFFFFKVLGIFLMIVELIWFIFLPIYKELMAWKEHSVDMTLNRNSTWFILLLILLSLVFVYPWQNTLYAPAVAQYEKEMSLFPSESGKIKLFNIANNQFVAANQPLFQISSIELEQQIEQAELQLQIDQELFEQQQVSYEDIEFKLISEQQLLGSISSLQGLKLQQSKLTTYANFDGKLIDFSPDVYDGLHVSNKTEVVKIIDIDSIIVEAYLREDQISRIQENASAVFYPSILDSAPISLKLIAMDKKNAAKIEQLELTSIHGGDIAVLQEDSGELVPEKAMYRALFKPTKRHHNLLSQVLKGTIHIEGERESLLTSAMNHIAMVFIRESGF